jgi:very-short-patch-repair endonuclease
MLEVLKNKEWMENQYHKLDLSMQNIADKLGTNRQRVRRALIRLGVEIKDKSTAQKAALAHGRAEHPTEGKERSDEVKFRIAESVAKDWANSDEDKLKNRSDKAKLQWANMTPEEREKLLKAAHDAVRVAAKEGSKLEKSLRKGLTNAGYDVSYHVVGLIPNQNLEVDLFLPGLSVAIEVDGPSHFLPIWGEESLARNIKADLHKTGLLLNQGLVIIRVKQMSSNISSLLKRRLLKVVLETVEKIEQEFPKEHNRLIELEV